MQSFGVNHINLNSKNINLRHLRSVELQADGKADEERSARRR
jgi:hypothetical protein